MSPRSFVRTNWLLAILLVMTCHLQASEWVQLSSRGFWFGFDKPEGWTIDYRSAAQIANFAIHEEGTTWRQAKAVIFARLIPRKEGETIEEFVSGDVDKFEENCPFFEIEDLSLDLKGLQKFTVKSYDCPGGRYEIVAVTGTARHFIVFVLSSARQDTAEAVLEPFKQILTSFMWMETR
ncbi:MAG: hypothetical protein ACRD1R_19465 [Acidobacteriota bacterium]